ncbi:MAG: CBS domain-containing protein [Dehalococcoidia bacterium]
MSARAAWRLESLGFSQVFRYTAGKADWSANGLPLEGTKVDIPAARDAARRDVPTCRLTDRVGDVRERAAAGGWDECVVVNDQGVVLGRLRQRELGAEQSMMVDAVLEPGPTTFRPDVPLEDLVRRMRERSVERVLITDSDGRLIGVLAREDAERRLQESAAIGGDGARVRGSADG